jgi:hypothetical protein
MIINRKPALSLNQALANKDLKIKHITGENYQKILFLKRKLRNSIDALVEDEVQLAKDIGYDPSNTETHKDFTDKLSVIQSAFKVIEGIFRMKIRRHHIVGFIWIPTLIISHYATMKSMKYYSIGLYFLRWKIAYEYTKKE